MKVAFVVGLLVGLVGGSLASASVVPKPGTGDPRIQTVQYDAQQVVTLRVSAGYALTVEFAGDEHIDNVALGNSGAWQVMPNKAADHLFIKPVVGAPTTDMTVITDSRDYTFQLESSPSPDPTMPYTVRFLYPATSVAAEDEPAEGSIYRFSGAKVLRPIQMSDDGRSTAITWGPKTAIPAVYVINAQGHEALVNGSIRDGRFVIDQVAGEFIFRLADDETHAFRRVVKRKH